VLEPIRRHPIACFVAIGYAASWGPWLAVAAGGERVGVGTSPRYLLGLAGPLIGAVITTGLVGGRTALRALLARMARVRVGLRWWGVALALPIGVAAAIHVLLVAYSMFLLAPIEHATWRGLGQVTGFPITNAAVLWLMLVVVGGFGEETGWRGFLLPVLRRRHSPLAASAIIAGLWAAWHAPLFLIDARLAAMPLAFVPVFLVALACAALFSTWLYERGGHSIALVAVWHGTYAWLTATVAARGAIAALETLVVMGFALVLLARELRSPTRNLKTSLLQETPS
jgi:membrane protease YdiL (CAAX protease family)